MSRRGLVRTSLFTALSLLLLFGTATPSWATGNIVKSDLKGTWRISLRGLTDCGFASMLATITMGTNGSGTGPLEIHGYCGDSTLPGETFTVGTLSKLGAGTASLTCGAGCQWNFNIQVAPDRSKMNLVDVNPLETTHFLDGVAILSSPADNIVVADLKGDWQLTLMGHQSGSCGPGPGITFSASAALSLNTSGAGNASVTLHTECGDINVVRALSVTGLNADGGGTAHLVCGGTCGFDFNIQVSPDRSMFNLVTVAPGNTGHMVAGVAIRRSPAGNITKPNLTGSWRGTILSQDIHDDVGGLLLSPLKLNVKGLSTIATVTFHDTEGDGTFTEGVAFNIVTLNPDGSGTACFKFEFACDFPLKIQVSPDRAIISVVGVEPGNEDFLAGLLIHQ
jgi:hypothetical protein